MGKSNEQKTTLPHPGHAGCVRLLGDSSFMSPRDYSFNCVWEDDLVAVFQVTNVFFQLS